MNLLEFALLQYSGYLLNGIGIFYTLGILWQKKVCLSKTFILTYFLFYFVVSSIIMLISLPFIETGTLAIIDISLEVIKFSTLVLYYMYLFKSTQIKKVISSLIIYLALESIISLFVLRILIFVSHLSFGQLYLLQISLTSISVLFFIYILSKTKIIIYFRELLNVEIIALPLTVFYLVVVSGMAYYTHEMGVNLSNSLGPALYQMLGGSIYILTFLAIGFLAREFYNKRLLLQTETLLVQQQFYVNRLEQIQQDLRMIQHDYKNMIAGLYAHVQQGNLEAVKEYIDKKLCLVDSELQQDIQQTNQITQIMDMELKGLVLVKIMNAKKLGVVIELEVLYPVEKIRIDTKDLIRCLGILLDNAIEEAQNTISKKITFVILQQTSCVTLIVKNNLVGNLDIAAMWQSGYSTKGKDRGLGLSNYKKILNRYENVYCETKVQQHQLHQIIVIT